MFSKAVAELQAFLHAINLSPSSCLSLTFHSTRSCLAALFVFIFVAHPSNRRPGPNLDLTISPLPRRTLAFHRLSSLQLLKQSLPIASFSLKCMMICFRLSRCCARTLNRLLLSFWFLIFIRFCICLVAFRMPWM